MNPSMYVLLYFKYSNSNRTVDPNRNLCYDYSPYTVSSQGKCGHLSLVKELVLLLALCNQF